MNLRSIFAAILIGLYAVGTFGQSIVTTQPAAPIRATHAILNGMVLPNLRPTLAWFEWGTNSQYGNVTDPVNVGNGSSVVRLSAPITNLVEGGVYHFRLVASNSVGTIRGFDRRFTTSMKIQNWGSYFAGVPSVPAGLTNLVAVAAGHAHCLALHNDGTVTAWMACRGMYPNHGQANVPAGLSNVVALAGGFSHSLALKEDGTIVGWGGYMDGSSATNIPPGLSNVIAIAAGDYNSLALKADGTLLGWGGTGSPSTFADKRNITAISCGSSHTIALVADPMLKTTRIDYWGSDLGSSAPPVSLGIADLVTEGWYNLALTTNGTVVDWGLVDHEIPKPKTLTNIIAAGTGYSYGEALRDDGTLVAWGLANEATNIPPGLSNVVTFASGDHHSLGLAPVNLPPFIFPISVSGITNRDLTIYLINGFDPNGDPLTTRIKSLPAHGHLYQYTSNGRGESITVPETTLIDAQRVIFAPDAGGSGAGYGTFQFCVNDGTDDSSTVACVVSIVPPPLLQSLELVQGATNALAVNFSGLPGVIYSVRLSANLHNWSWLGRPAENPPGQFRFLDYAYTNSPVRFYRLSSP